MDQPLQLEIFCDSVAIKRFGRGTGQASRLQGYIWSSKQEAAATSAKRTHRGQKLDSSSGTHQASGCSKVGEQEKGSAGSGHGPISSSRL